MMYSTVGWSDLALLRFTKLDTLLLISYFFRNSIPKKLAKSAALAAKFSFKKTKDTHKMNIIFENLQILSFYSKEQ